MIKAFIVIPIVIGIIFFLIWLGERKSTFKQSIKDNWEIVLLMIIALIDVVLVLLKCVNIISISWTVIVSFIVIFLIALIVFIIRSIGFKKTNY